MYRSITTVRSIDLRDHEIDTRLCVRRQPRRQRLLETIGTLAGMWAYSHPVSS